MILAGMERIPHSMKVTKTIDYPSNLLFFDTETRGEIDKKNMSKSKHTFFMGYVYATRLEKLHETRIKQSVLNTIADFWAFLKRRLDERRPLYCFAHNLPFDLTILNFWNYVEQHNLRFDFSVMEDPPCIFLLKINECKVYFIDTMNYWRLPLSEIGKSVGIEKTEMPNDYSRSKEWVSYCSNDVIILKEAIIQLIRFLNENDLGSFGLTTPSIAMKCFKHKFLKKDTIYIHDNKRCLEIERGSYYGGYTANFFVGQVKKEVFYLDVNSLYPSVMRNDFPVKLIRYMNNPNIKEVRRVYKNKGICAEVEILDHDNSYPKRVEGKLCYCLGHYNTYLCGPELVHAIEHDSIASIYRFAYYDMKPIFKDFVDYFYNLRLRYKQTGNKTYDYFTKLIMNSLYGKFGQQGFRWLKLTRESLMLYYDIMNVPFPDCYDKELIEPDANWIENKWYAANLDHGIPIRSVHQNIQIKFPVGEHHESCPIIAGYVTGYGRSLLHSYIGIAGNDNVFYCDTDSLFVTKRGRDRLIRSNSVSDSTLGLLKLEGSSKLNEFWGPKDYVFGGKQTLKGIRSNAIMIGDNEYMQNRFEGLASILKRGGDPFITIEWINKHLTRRYTKGTVDKKGRVHELVLNEFS